MQKFICKCYFILVALHCTLKIKDMKNATSQGIEIVVLTATFANGTTNATADLYREKNKSFVTAVAAGTCAPIDAEFVGTQVMNPTSTKVILTIEGAQENSYSMIDDCGRIIGYVYASNIKDASRKAIESKTPRLWKVRREYTGGVRG